MFISFKFPCEDIVLDLSKICVFVSFDVCSCSECVIDVCLCSECVINVCLCVLKSVIDVCVQSVIEAVRQINTDPARTPTALAVKILSVFFPSFEVVKFCTSIPVSRRTLR